VLLYREEEKGGSAGLDFTLQSGSIEESGRGRMHERMR